MMKKPGTFTRGRLSTQVDFRPQALLFTEQTASWLNGTITPLRRPISTCKEYLSGPAEHCLRIDHHHQRTCLFYGIDVSLDSPRKVEANGTRLHIPCPAGLMCVQSKTGFRHEFTACGISM